MASAPDAQAETGVCTPARAPTSRPTLADGPLGISIGTVCGETRRTPFSLSTSYWSRRVVTPPMPEAMTAPRRSGSTLSSSPALASKPASAHASLAAISANCAGRSRRRACGRGMTSEGSTAICAAIRTACSAAHSCSRGLTPDLPATRPSQVEAASPPSGVVAPIPVTTTVRLVGLTGNLSPTVRGLSGATAGWRGHAAGPMRWLGPGGPGPRRGSGLVLEDVGGRVADRLEVLDVLVGDLDVEALFGGDDDLDHGQRVDVQVVGEGLVQLDVLNRDAGDLVDDVGETGDDLFLSGGHVRRSFFDIQTVCGARRGSGR